MKSKRTKATDIPMSVKKKVWERDNHCCIVCGNSYGAMPNAHILPRSNGGRGIETNIVTLCGIMTENKCHYYYDNGTKKQRQELDDIICNYMRSIYGESWSKKDQKYHK